MDLAGLMAVLALPADAAQRVTVEQLEQAAPHIWSSVAQTIDWPEPHRRSPQFYC
jgi:hypothetical protein